MNNTILKESHNSTMQMNVIHGELVNFENESYYKISNSDAMRPFL